MILSRYDSGADFVNRVTSALEDRGIPYDGKDDADSFRPPDTPRAGRGADDGGVSVFSAHQAKGREAPHVILLHVAAGADGFSPDVRNDELLDLARDVRASEGTEERCLFYVAVTRSESTLDLLTRSGEESVFLEEIGAHVSRPTGVADPGRSVRKSRLRPGLGNCGMRRPRARHTRGSSRTGAVGSNSSRGRTPPHRTYKSMLATA
ncbi:3'-5' exonuclease [Halostagnicola sp. A56]|uniref:3'-5' exonuclease n=1 Tax=Halostagnicola sp. A56 TaxID=1495067 RepID=UPI002100B656|nr:3'-5' exonuclease [Halostagnicola sp. A56]